LPCFITTVVDTDYKVPEEPLNYVFCCVFFRTIFEEYQSKLHTFFPEGIQPIPCTFHPRAVFERMIQFVERLKIVEVTEHTTVF
jgi:hypothetical protein